jgi:hypothetical protein
MLPESERGTTLVCGWQRETSDELCFTIFEVRASVAMRLFTCGILVLVGGHMAGTRLSSRSFLNGSCKTYGLS